MNYLGTFFSGILFAFVANYICQRYLNHYGRTWVLVCLVNFVVAGIFSLFTSLGFLPRVVICSLVFVPLTFLIFRLRGEKML